MNRLDQFLAWAEANRLVISVWATVLVIGIAALDWILPNTSVGFLYLIPVLLSAAALNGRQIVGLALLCAYLRESFDPLQGGVDQHGVPLPFVLNPLRWANGATGRFLVATAGFAMTGFFVSELNQRRRLLAAHLKEREESEQQVRVLIETSPLAILTLDAAGRVQLANESARELLGFDDEDPLQGKAVGPYLPILKRLLDGKGGGGLRTSVECKGQRRDGEVFLAHVWLATYRTSKGPGLAAVVWDASENLRDREGAGLDSMMATSRVLVGAMSHEIRNLAAAAALAHTALGENGGVTGRGEQYLALGSLIRGLEKIAASGLRVASDREAAVADLDTVMDETRIVIEPGLREAGIELAWEVQGGLPLVQADHHSLLQVFVNLARNSQEALESASGGGGREVRVSAGVESDLVIVRVSDTGPGVAHPDELFKPFQPGAHSLGLGLYISRAILRAHGGGLRYEPRERGSCFAVELWPAENPNDER
jgi:two-component system, LuxR family, sensor kinase FixL